MIEHELLLLGLLRDSPKHGYQIKKEINGIFSLFTGVDLQSIYYPLGVLEKRGLVAKYVNRQGRRPKRLVYKLTDKGESRFTELLTKSLLSFKRPQFSLDLSLYFLHYLKPAIAKRRLAARIVILNRLARDMNQTIRSLLNKDNLSLTQILEHNLRMVEAESEFLTHLTKGP